MIFDVFILKLLVESMRAGKFTFHIYNVDMVIYLYGPDSYRRQKKLRALISEYKKKYPNLDFFSVDLEEEPNDWEKVKNFLNQPSMFVDSKVAVVQNPCVVKQKEWITTIISFLDKEKTFLLFSEEKRPPKDFAFLLESPARAQEFRVLAGRQLEMFVREEAEARGIKFTPDALTFFIGFLELEEERSWIAVTELDRLSFLKHTQPLSQSELEIYINHSLKLEVFRIAKEIISAEDWKRRISLLEQMFLQRESGAHIFNSLAYISRGSKLVALADYDIAVKSGKMEYEEALLRFVLTDSQMFAARNNRRKHL